MSQNKGLLDKGCLSLDRQHQQAQYSEFKVDKQYQNNPPASQRKTTSQVFDKEFFRAPSEDDDGYDPYSDRPALPEPLFEQDPWG